MSLVYMRGFDDGEFTKQNWVANVSFPSSWCSYTTGRTGPNALMIAGTYYAEWANMPSLNHAIIGMAVKPEPYNYQSTSSLRTRYLHLGGAADIRTYYNGTDPNKGNIDGYRLQVVLPGTGSILTPGSVLWRGVWSYIEYDIDTVSGTFVCRIDGVEVMNVTGVNYGSNKVSRLYIQGNDYTTNASYKWHIDDIYILDADSPGLNSFLGPQRVRALAVDGTGAHNDFVGSDGNSIDNHLLVDEFPPSSTDYVESSTPGAKQSFNLAALPGNPVAVNGVSVSSLVGTEAGGSGTVKTFIEHSGTQSSSANRPVNEVYTIFRDRHETNPVTGLPWTIADVNALQVGTEIVS